MIVSILNPLSSSETRHVLLFLFISHFFFLYFFESCFLVVLFHLFTFFPNIFLTVFLG
jgi:hypothetical protein